MVFFKKKIEIRMPVNGQVVFLEDVPDEAFSKKIVGDGCAFIPREPIICSPVEGEVVTVFPTKHAIGLRSVEGVELLLHIGIDTVELKGNGFESLVKVGDQVRIGTPLSKIDMEYIKGQGKSMISPLIITNHYQIVKIEDGKKEIGNRIMKVVEGR